MGRPCWGSRVSLLLQCRQWARRVLAALGMCCSTSFDRRDARCGLRLRVPRAAKPAMRAHAVQRRLVLQRLETMAGEQSIAAALRKIRGASPTDPDHSAREGRTQQRPPAAPDASPLAARTCASSCPAAPTCRNPTSLSGDAVKWQRESERSAQVLRAPGHRGVGSRYKQGACRCRGRRGDDECQAQAWTSAWHHSPSGSP